MIRLLYLGNDSQSPLELPVQSNLGGGPSVLVSDLLELRVQQEVRHLLSPGQIRGAKWGVANHDHLLLDAEAPGKDIGYITYKRFSISGNCDIWGTAGP